ncbi:hypothetical protein BpHYR1_010846 [Brachionus plicatilis]|uniref:Uncharacterized protein n=1 Tax=Brachionus plicatilis TaxID=10195 RepID=A0A3M7RW97_BRAPC|nr:hypothetical protein BpHYR1_010846 [Brachionus plicatilis]
MVNVPSECKNPTCCPSSIKIRVLSKSSLSERRLTLPRIVNSSLSDMTAYIFYTIFEFVKFFLTSVFLYVFTEFGNALTFNDKKLINAT